MLPQEIVSYHTLKHKFKNIGLLLTLKTVDDSISFTTYFAVYKGKKSDDQEPMLMQDLSELEAFLRGYEFAKHKERLLK